MANPEQASFKSEHWRPMVTVDIVIFAFQNDKLKLLLIKRKNDPFNGSWAIPGGFIEQSETLIESAQRELGEETGLKAVYLEQLYTFGRPDRDPRGRVISVAYFAVLPQQKISIQAGDDADAAQWFPIDQVPNLAFDHKHIVEVALQRLRSKLEYTNVGFRLLSEQFTLTELQNAYEIVLGEELDKRNFRRRILQAGILKETGKFRSGEGRPAKLYRYIEDSTPDFKTRRLFP